jgi:hypothetical protein
MSTIIPEEWFNKLVKDAINSLDLETRLKDVDPFQSIHFITSTHYSTLIHLGDGEYKIQPRYNEFSKNNGMKVFVRDESRDYYTLGFIPLDNEARELLVMTPRLEVLFGRVPIPSGESFDLYMRKA